MPPRSKLVTILPPEIRREVERRMLEQGFRDYKGLAQWVHEQGYKISDDSLWRYGKAFQQQLAESELAGRQVRALAEMTREDAGQLSHALTHVSAQKIFSALVEAQELNNGDLS